MEFKNLLKQNNLIGKNENINYVKLSNQFKLSPKSKKNILYKANSTAYKKYIKDHLFKIVDKIKKRNETMKKIEELNKKIEEQNKQIEKVEKEVKQYTINKDDIKLASSTVKISSRENSNYNFFTHQIELDKMKKLYKNNVIYSQTVKYYIDGELLDGLVNINTDEEPIEVDFTENTTTMRNITPEIITLIELKNTDGASGGDWKPALLKYVKGGYTKIITSVYKQIPYLRHFADKEQIFQDNEKKTCLLDGCIRYFENLSEKNRNAKAILNKLEDDYDDYCDGLRESELDEFCNKYGFSIHINNLVDGSKKIFNTSQFKRFSIEFANTRYNHVDLLSHNYDDAVEVSKDEYKEIKNNVSYYVEKYGRLITIDRTYKIKESDYSIMSKQFKNDINYDTLFIRKDSDSYELIKTYNFNVHTFFNSNLSLDDDLYYELDAKKAYYNFSDKSYNKYYKGVPSGSMITFNCNDKFNIDTFNEVNLVGFYQVEIIDIIDKFEHMQTFGFYKYSIHTLTTSNIELLQKYLKFRFINASYAPTVDFSFHEGFLHLFDTDTGDLKYVKDKKSIKGYCKFFGCMLAENESVIKIKPLRDDINYYNLINKENYEMYKDEKGIISIYDKNHVQRRYTHINYTIHGYLMTLIMEKILDININDVFGVKLDSIIIKKDKIYDYDKKIFDTKKANIKNMFNEKSFDISVNDFNFTSAYYSSLKIPYTGEELTFKKMFTPNEEFLKDRIILCNGAGGTGKTHSLLTFLENKETCYTSLSWKLINGKKEEFKSIIGLSLQKLTGKTDKEKCEKITNNYIRYIIIDELTLIGMTNINDIKKLYPQCFIFLVGDIDNDDFFYQCSTGCNSVFKPSQNNIQSITYTKTYRFDDELDKKIKDLRDAMKKYHNVIYGNRKLFDYVKKEFSMCFKNKEDIIYNYEDIGVSEYDDYKYSNTLTNYFISKGAREKYFIKMTNINNGQIRGLQLENKPDHKNYEMRLFHTIHSFQGLQLNHNNKIIINIKNNYDFNLLYTAISRARRLDQINFIIN
jgi:hypothetical protein